MRAKTTKQLAIETTGSDHKDDSITDFDCKETDGWTVSALIDELILNFSYSNYVLLQHMKSTPRVDISKLITNM
jgi:hypothetical protein